MGLWKKATHALFVSVSLYDLEMAGLKSLLYTVADAAAKNALRKRS
jgi:hypothetical protein